MRIGNFMLALFAGLSVGCLAEAAELIGDPCSTEGAFINGTSGNFTSPGYDGVTKYPVSIICKWTIEVPADHKVLLNFLVLDVERYGKCKGDWVVLYSGPNITTADEISSNCGENELQPSPMMSKGSIMTVVFSSDYMEARTGFVVGFAAVSKNVVDSGCGNPRFILEEQTISTRGYPSPYSTGLCVWNIEAPIGKIILFKFLDMEMTMLHHDELQFYDGNETTDNHHDIYTNNPANDTIITSTNLARVVILSTRPEDTTMAAGFMAYIKFIDPGEASLHPQAINMKKEKYLGVCGETHISPRVDSKLPGGRIVGGVEAISNSWPWQAQIRDSTDRERRPHCGATIISASWVTTAGHCAQPPDPIFVWVGVHYHFTLNHKTQISGIKTKIMHPQYRVGASWNNDISLLEMIDPFTFDQFVRPACLPTADVEFELGTVCYVSGWGDDYNSNGWGPKYLHEAPIPLLSREYCRTKFAHELTENMFCAGYDEGGIDACSGDSGGPLVCRKPGQKNWVLWGTTSWGFGCAKPGIPGVYVKMNMYGDWIAEQTSNDAIANYNNDGVIIPITTTAPETTLRPTTVQAKVETTQSSIQTTASQTTPSQTTVTYGPEVLQFQNISYDEPILITGGSGKMLSPYAPSLNITFVMSGSHTGSVVEMSFKEFNVQAGGETICMEDYILVNLIWHGSIPYPAEKYCGTDPPKGLAANIIKITLITGKLQARSSSNRKGFLAEFSETDPCNETLQLPDTAGSVLSPNFPVMYPPETVCKWTLNSTGIMTHIHFSKFVNMSTASNGNCADSVTISSQNDESLEQFNEVYCGIDEHADLELTGLISIIFSSDNETDSSNSGFMLTYVQRSLQQEISLFHDNAVDGACENTLEFMGTSGNFTGSRQQKENADGICEWKIRVPQNMSVCLHPPKDQSYLLKAGQASVTFVGPTVLHAVGFDAEYLAVPTGRSSPIISTSPILYICVYMMINLFKC